MIKGAHSLGLWLSSMLSRIVTNPLGFVYTKTWFIMKRFCTVFLTVLTNWDKRIGFLSYSHMRLQYVKRICLGAADKKRANVTLRAIRKRQMDLNVSNAN